MFGKKQSKQSEDPKAATAALLKTLLEKDGVTHFHHHRGEVCVWWIQDVDCYSVSVHAWDQNSGVQRNMILAFREIETNGGMEHVIETARRMVRDIHQCKRDAKL